MSRKKFFKWVIEVQVAPIWVEDGFDLSQETHNRLSTLLPFANEGEIKVKILKAPSPKAIRKIQGYEQ